MGRERWGGRVGERQAGRERRREGGTETNSEEDWENARARKRGGEER